MRAELLFASILRWYPADFRARFETEMLATIGLALASSMTAAERIACIVREASGLAGGALREWIAKLTVNPIARARTLPDCRLMRPVGITRAEWAAGLTHVGPHAVQRASRSARSMPVHSGVNR